MNTRLPIIPHLLLIDDDEDEFRILSEGLKDADIACQVTWAIGPQHGLAILKYFTPQFIFMDYRMPKMNGIECIGEIKKMSEPAQVPVVLYSSEIDAELARRALEAGAAACLRKTTHMAQLAEALKNIFTHNALADQLQKLHMM